MDGKSRYDTTHGRPLALKYGLAMLSVTASLILSLWSHPTDLRGAMFFPAIVVTGLLAGLGPAVFAALASALVVRYFLLSPQYTLSTSWNDLPQIAAYLFSGILIAWVSASRRRSLVVLQSSQDEQKGTAQELNESAELLDLLNDAVIACNNDGSITYWNQGAETIFGWRREEALGRVSDQLLKTRFLLPLPEIMAELSRRGRWDGELIKTRNDGRQVTVAGRWAPRKDGQGRSIGTFRLYNDITEHKRIDAALQCAQTELQHATRVMAMGELTASISHETNQPLAAIAANGHACLHWLAGETPNLNEARQTVERIIEDANRASTVLHRIRALVLKTPVATVSVDMNGVINTVVALLKIELLQAGATLRMHLASDLPRVLADPIQLQQVVLNLIMNGLEAMRSIEGGQKKLFISSAQDEAGNLLVRVEDTGPGLGDTRDDRIFQAFYTTKPNGMGLGLPTSRTIIERFGGRLWAASDGGPGAKFMFTLPPCEAMPES